MGTTDYSGQTLDNRYRLIRLLGKGGMGSVYLGEHKLIGREVAVKFLHAELASNKDVVKRFYREARTAAAIRHKNIIEVLDVGLAPWDDPYMVMEYLEGEDLGAMIKRTGPLSLPAACGIMVPALNALAAAHEKKIVHRDLKPENIFLVYQPEKPPLVKLIDFGISKFSQSGDQTKLTQTGSLLGTPAYMSPEQARGTTTVDHRTDVYAMGVVLYEMLTGGLPFTGPTFAALLSKLLTELPRSPFEVNPQFPVEAEWVVSRALSKDPADRHQNVQELLNDLKRLTSVEQRQNSLAQFATTMHKNSFAVGDLGGEENAEETGNVAAEVFTNVVGGETPREWTGGTRLGKGKLLGIVAGTVVLIVAVLVVGFLFVDSNKKTESMVVPLAPSPTPAFPKPTYIEPSKDEGVEITVEGSPQGAKIYYERAPVPMNPFRVDRKKTIAAIEVKAKGYEPFITSVIPSKDLAVRVEMKPAQAEPRVRTKPAAISDPWRKSSNSSNRRASSKASRPVSKDTVPEARIETPPKLASSKGGSNELDDLIGRSSIVSKKKKPLSKPVRTGSSETKASLDRYDVQKGMNSVAGAVRRCGQGQKGTVVMKVIIGKKGRVQSASVVGPFVGTPVGSCAARAVRGARFPKSEHSLTVRYPFKL